MLTKKRKPKKAKKIVPLLESKRMEMYSTTTIFRLLNYFNLFDYPVTQPELTRLLNFPEPEINRSINELLNAEKINRADEYCFLPGKGWTISKRRSAEVEFNRNIQRIYRASWILAQVPFVRGLLLTGTVARNVYDRYGDIDFLVITAPQRMWLCRLLILAIRKILSFNYRTAIFRFWCTNFFIDGADLTVPDQNEFTGLEICFSQPVLNLPLYHRFIQVNEWVKQYYNLPPTHMRTPFVLTKYCGLTKIGEIIINLFFPSCWESKLAKFFYRHWYRTGVVTNKDEFRRLAGKNFIKTDFGYRQQFLIDKLTRDNFTEQDNRLRTKVKLKTYTRSVFQQRQAYDILLTHAYFFKYTSNEKKIRKPYVPLGPLSVAAYLKSQSLNVGFYDTTFQDGVSSFARYIHQTQPSVVGIYTLETTRKNVIPMLEICRAIGSLVIVGGPDATNVPEFYLKHGADLAVLGEGEFTVHEILHNFQTGTRQITDIEGIYTEKGYSPVRKLIPNLDVLPIPARELVDFTPYFTIWKKTHNITSIHLNTSRGCPYTCTWCSKPVYGTSYRQRSAETVVAEMDFISKTYHPDQLWFTDDIFGLNKSWVTEFHRLIVQRGIKIPYECLCRVDLVTPDLVKQLKETGCFRIWYGAESGSQKVLDLMKKKFTVDQIKYAVRVTQAVGIKVGFFVMLGYPGETVKDIDLTRKLIRETKPDACGTAVAYPIQGTVFYETVKDKLLPAARSYRVENTNRLIFKSKYHQVWYTYIRRFIGKEFYLIHHPNLGLTQRVKYYVYTIACLIFKRLYRE